MNDIPQSIYDAAWKHADADGTGEPMKQLVDAFGDLEHDDRCFERVAVLCLNVLYVFASYWRNSCDDNRLEESVCTLASWVKNMRQQELPPYFPHERIAIRGGKYFLDCRSTSLMSIARAERYLQRLLRNRDKRDCYEFMDWSYGAYSDGCYTHQVGDPNFGRWIANALLQPSWNRCLIFDPANCG